MSEQEIAFWTIFIIGSIACISFVIIYIWYERWFSRNYINKKIPVQIVGYGDKKYKRAA